MTKFSFRVALLPHNKTVSDLSPSWVRMFSVWSLHVLPLLVWVLQFFPQSKDMHKRWTDTKLSVCMKVCVCRVRGCPCIQGVSLPMAQNSGTHSASSWVVLEMDGYYYKSNLKVVEDTFLLMSRAMCPISCQNCRN